MPLPQNIARTIYKFYASRYNTTMRRERLSPPTPLEETDHQTIITIDPDTKIAGLAVFDAHYNNPIDRYVVRLRKSYTIDHHTPNRRKEKMDWNDRTPRIAIKISDIVYFALPQIVIIEYPQLFHSARGDAAANTGALVKLSYAVGAITQAIVDQYRLEPSNPHTPPEIRLVFPITWKGNTPKDVTLKRIQNHWGVNPPIDDNEADAIGIGDWFFRKSSHNKNLHYKIVPKS